MAFATSSDGVRIHYELEGDGPPLLLHHGFSGSLWGWRDFGYTDALRESHQLILIDGRGHGESDKPRDPLDYLPQRRVDDVIAVLDDVGVERTTFWGYSMGGQAGYPLLQRASDRLSRAVIGGMHPYHQDRAEEWVTRIAALSKGMAAMVESLEQQTGNEVTEPRRSRMLANDAEALIAATQANINEHSGLLADTRPDEGAQSLPLTDVPVPTLVYCGTEDPFYAGAERAGGELPNGEFFSLAGLNHMEGMQRSDVVLPRVGEFLRSD